VQDVIATAVGGVTVGQSVEGLERYPINLRYPQEYRDSAESLQSLPIVTPSGLILALSDIADIRIEDGPPGIKSENARINGWTFIDIENVDMGSYVESAIKMVDERLKLPPGYAIKWSGQYEYMVRAETRLKLFGPLTILIITLLLYANFRRPQEVLIILGTLPLSLIGGVWLLYLLDFNISVAVGVGFIALAGVSVEIGMIVLVYLNEAYDEATQTEPTVSRTRLIDIVVEGAGRRIRPVIMTVTATIVGLLPILFGTGTGAEVMTRMAAPMVGGMLSAFVLTMLVLPVIFLEWKSIGINEPV
jgi:Cu(I)/Ag(I) efflux system membrane protein CusA/SilA